MEDRVAGSRRTEVGLVGALIHRLEVQPDLTIGLDGTRATVADLADRACTLAAALAESVAPGDRVGVMARNGRVALLTWWATVLCGGYVVPFNTNNRGAVLAHQLADSEPALVVAETEFAEVVRAALAEVGSAVPMVVAGTAGAENLGGSLDFDDLLDHGGRLDLRPEVDPYGISHLVYTAGTTGPSKACMVSHGYLANFARQMWQNLQRAPDDRLWTPMPIFHLAAITHTLGSLQIGSPITLATRFSVSNFWPQVLAADASMAALMGSMLVLVANAPVPAGDDAVRGRLRVVSGSPVTPELARTWQHRFGVDRVGSGTYGMTEAALLTMTPPGQYRAGAAGKVTDSFDLRIVDEHDNPLPVGQVGEIVCRPTSPATMFNGYWRRPEETLATLRGLWFHCGDYGRFDEDGYLYFVDRGKDYLRRGGENISSYEIERVIAGHPQVAEVAVHAVRSALAEDEVKATVVLRSGADSTERELSEWIAPRVPRYAIPRFIELREELPRNAVGRVLKHQLRADGITASTWSADRA